MYTRIFPLFLFAPMVKLVSVLLCVCGLDGLPETFDHALPVRLVTLAQGILSEKQMIPETIASLVRNELLLSSSSESSELRERIDMEALRKLLFGLMVKSTYETHLVYAGFEDGTWMAYYNANDPVEGSYAFSNSSQCGSSFCGSTWRVENVTGRDRKSVV